MNKVQYCPICNSQKFKSHFECKDYYATGEEFLICDCEQCGFRFTQNFPDEDKISRYYETSDYISHSNTQKGIVNKIYHFVRSFMLRRKANLIEKIAEKKQGTLLDFGCGIGFFLNEMNRRGWSVQGIEKSEEARRFAEKQFGLNIFSNEKVASLDSKTYDVITSWHSMEHIEFLNQTIDQLQMALKDDGVWFLAVPNSVSMDEKIYKSYWAAYDVPRHLWHFSPKSMSALLQKHGLTIQEMYPMPFDAFYISMLSEKYKGNRFSFIRGFVSGLYCYVKSISNIENSSSIIYIIRKS
ncbi:MAG: class I SAM-dependent methyltransferase [Paludibacteraceae bacterium]|nr:class I SAM-dependent methyltransferase [Paludibacteraceae bacterium]